MKIVRIYGKYLSQYTVLYIIIQNSGIKVPRYIPEIHFAATPRIAP